MMLSEAYFHTLDPFALQISGDFGIRWYGLSYLAGFCLAWLFVKWMAKSGRTPLKHETIGDLIFVVIIGTLIGGRVGYACFYGPELLWDFSAAFPFWGVLAVNKGGMSSHGGIVGVVGACCWYAYRQRVSPLVILDLGAIGTTAGLFLGRLANFVNGELPGKRVEDQSNPPSWSMKFPQEIDTWSTEQLVSMTEPLHRLGVMRGDWLSALETLNANPKAPPADAARFVSVNINKLIEACQSGNTEVIDAMRPHLTAVWPSQLIQAATDGPILAGALALIWWGPRRVGVVGGWFGIMYGILRIASEVVREPDAGVERVLGLSRGQLLSVGLIVVGTMVLVIAMTRRDPVKHGGLVRRLPDRNSTDTTGDTPSHDQTPAAD